MRREAIIKYIGYVLLFNSLFLYVSAIISFYLNETSFVPLFYSGLVCTILGLFPLIFTERIDEVRFSEGLAISVTGWFITCIVGMLPYLMWEANLPLLMLSSKVYRAIQQPVLLF